MDQANLDISVKDGNDGSRKKTPKVSQRHIAKNKRYQDKDPHLKKFKRPCKHAGKSFYCNSLNESDIKRIKRRFYATSDKITQDIKLCHFISVGPVERKRPIKPNPRERSINAIFHLKSKKNEKPIRVCQKFFTKAFGVSPCRVNKLCKKIHNGDVPKELRGGDRVSHKSQDKKKMIIEFIDNLRGTESHYNRLKSKRIYLPADLSISKLHKIYNDQCTDESYRCSLTMFKIIFRTKFNIGFSSPASDCCSLCNRLKHKIKMEKDPRKKSNLMIERRVHTIRAKAFYELTKENPPDSLSFCFDMQQVQPLPRTPISDAFYAHQVSFYVFCCVDMKAKSPTFYTWTENLAGRGSVEVGSALLSHLNSLNLKDVKTLRLFCDGCGGQNKNAHVVHALYFWLRKQSPKELSEIRLIFPVRGHSFLPADRVFGRVEKELRKHPSIKKKEEYESLYSNFGEIKTLGNEWSLYDIKSFQDILKKIEGISDLKRIVLKKNCLIARKPLTVTCFQNFRYEGATETPKVILKRGKKECELKLKELELGRRLKEKKKKSLTHLLVQAFGEDWSEEEDLIWYKNMLTENDIDQEQGNQEVDEEDEDIHCDCLEDDGALHI